MKFYHMRKIFRSDWKRILTNPVALLVATGIAIIPGLYAWVNIMACWDVYENTGNIPVAIVNNDRPAEFRDKEIFIGASVVEQLKDNDKLDWHFVSERDADLGLADGTYFAVIELPEDFSYNFTTLLSQTPVKPKIVFKVDNKVNPVAEKITESAKNTLVQEIKSSFIATVNQTIFSMLNPVGEDADANLENILKMKDAIVNLNRNMDLITTTLDNLHTNSINLNRFLTSINATWPLVENGLEILEKTAVNQQELSRATQQRLNQSLTYMDTNLSYVDTSSDRVHALLSELNQAAKEGSTAQLDSVFLNLDITLSAMSSAVEATASYLEEYKEIDWSADIKNIRSKLESLQSSLSTLYGDLGDLRTRLAQLDIDAIYGGLETTIGELETLSGNLEQIISDLHDLKKNEDLKRIIPANLQNNLDNTIDNMISALRNMQAAVNSLFDALNALYATKDDVKAVVDTIDQTAENAMKMIEDIQPIIGETINFLKAVENSMSDKTQQLNQMIASLSAIKTELDSMRTKLSDIHKQSDAASLLAAGKADTINNDLYQIEKRLTSILKAYHQSIRGDISTIGNRLVTFADNSAKLAQSAQKLGSEIGNMLSTAQEGAALTADLTIALSSKLKEFESTINALGGKLEVVNNDDIVQIISILQNDPELMGDFIAMPFDQEVQSVYAIPNYGSSMAPIYTALALWVGCLFLNSVLKSRPPAIEGVEFMTLHEKHYGKMMTFCSIAVLQGLIVSLGDVLMLKIYTVNAALFVLVAVFSSLVFCIIAFTLYSTFGNAGKALAIIYLIFQIPSSGGTYPIQVNPLIFRVLQPLSPFTYTVSGFREAIAGPSTSQVLLDFTMLALFALVFLIAGYFLLEKTEEPVRRFEETFKNSGLSE